MFIVSANNYTVAVKGFDSNIIFSEAELKKHFAEVILLTFIQNNHILN